jgi:hypothetical protein
MIVRQVSVMTIGQIYRAQITISCNASTNSLFLGDGAGSAELGITAGATGTFTVTFTAAGTNLNLNATTTGLNLTVDEVILVPVSNTTLSTLGTNAGTFFGYLRGIDTATFGPLAPLVALLITGFLVIFSVKLITFLLPIIAALFGIVRKIISAVMEFLPL